MTEADAPLLRDPAIAGLEAAQACWLRSADGRRLRAAWFPAVTPKGSVVLSPGRTEYIEKYLEVIGELVGRGFSVVVHDWRGQGLSDRLLPDALRGHAAGFEAFLDDYDALVTAFADRLPRPRIAMGHSMGGCLTLLGVARDPGRFDGVILSAPMLGLKTGPSPAWQARTMAWLMAHTGHAGDYVLGAVGDPFAAAFEADRLTHDRARYERSHAQLLSQRELALGNVTWGWLDSAFTAVSRVRTNPLISKIPIPVVILGAGEDRLVRSADAKAVAARLSKGRYVEVAGAYHEILMETDDIRAVFWREFDALAAAIARPG